jgi:hypothetical protein
MSCGAGPAIRRHKPTSAAAYDLPLPRGTLTAARRYLNLPFVRWQAVPKASCCQS